MNYSSYFLTALLPGIFSGISLLSMNSVHAVDQGWPVHGATPEGTRYSSLGKSTAAMLMIWKSHGAIKPEK